MSEYDQRAMYAARDAIQSLTQNLSWHSENIDRLRTSIDELVNEIRILNEHNAKTAGDRSST